jgi:hypothetical protein
MLSDIYAECHNQAIYAECRYAECRGALCLNTDTHVSNLRCVFIELFSA